MESSEIRRLDLKHRQIQQLYKVEQRELSSMSQLFQSQQSAQAKQRSTFNRIKSKLARSVAPQEICKLQSSLRREGIKLEAQEKDLKLTKKWIEESQGELALLGAKVEKISSLCEREKIRLNEIKEECALEDLVSDRSGMSSVEPTNSINAQSTFSNNLSISDTSYLKRENTHPGFTHSKPQSEQNQTKQGATPEEPKADQEQNSASYKVLHRLENEERSEVEISLDIDAEQSLLALSSRTGKLRQVSLRSDATLTERRDLKDRILGLLEHSGYRGVDVSVKPLSRQGGHGQGGVL